MLKPTQYRLMTGDKAFPCRLIAALLVAKVQGIPTTRAGTCVTSDTRIVRDPLYDGGWACDGCTCPGNRCALWVSMTLCQLVVQPIPAAAAKAHG
jgi:hypothetical protein